MRSIRTKLGVLAALSSLILAGCAADARTKARRTYAGETQEEVLARYGRPQSKAVLVKGVSPNPRPAPPFWDTLAPGQEVEVWGYHDSTGTTTIYFPLPERVVGHVDHLTKEGLRD